ncbi:MAG: sulfur relay protein DsrC [Gammaproteobacteria bacterium]|nr:sulfur relay protein DsrC [Gammaproteobacteria bacterium]
MLNLSEVLIQNPEIDTFTELKVLIEGKAASSGELFFRIDVKPSYPDTPENWEDQLEGAFVGVHSVTR